MGDKMINTKSLTILLTVFLFFIISPNFSEADTSIQEHDFGNVEVGSTLTVSVNISTTTEDGIKLSGIQFMDQDNICSDMTLSQEILIDGEEPLNLFHYPDYFLFPLDFFLYKGQILTVKIIYSPSAPGECSRTLGIYGPCPPTGCGPPIDKVFFTGTGVEQKIEGPEPDKLSQLLLKKLQEIIDYTNESYTYHTLNSFEQDTLPDKRFKAFKKMIVVTYHFVENGHFEAAYNKLNEIHKRTDGKPGSNNFVPSENAEDLNSMVRECISIFEFQKKQPEAKKGL
jgi:hypothetical protein